MEFLTILIYLAISFVVFISLHWVTEKNHGVFCAIVGLLWPFGVVGLVIYGAIALWEWYEKSTKE